MDRGQLRAVVFDLGGVLLDWNPRHLYRKLFDDPGEMEEFLAQVCTDAWHHAHDLGADRRQSCELLAEQHPSWAPGIMAWFTRGEEMVAGQFDETVGVLRALTSAGVPCYALSNMEPDAFAARRIRFPFLEWFDGWVISGLEGVAKPDPRIFEILLERYRLDPAQCVFIDDRPQNVTAGRRLGMTGLHYTNAGELKSDLARLGLPC